MGGSKFRLGRVRKYTDQQKRKPVTLMVSIPRSLVSVQASTGLYLSPCPIRDTYSDCSDTPPSESSPLTVSFPLARFMKCSVPSLTSLSHRLSLFPLPPQWVMLCSVPLTLSKVDVLVDGNPGVTVSLTFNEQLQWAAMIAWKRINPGLSSLFFNLPLIVKNVEDVLKVVQFFGSVKLCIGNPDTDLVNMWKKKCSSLHRFTGK